MSPLSGCTLVADLRARPAGLEDLRERGRRLGPREIEALGRFAAARTQEIELAAGLHAYRRHPLSKRMRHGDDGFDQCTGRIVQWDFFQERAIQFYGVDGISAKVVE